jgi:hypothetical protein
MRIMQFAISNATGSLRFRAILTRDGIERLEVKRA